MHARLAVLVLALTPQLLGCAPALLALGADSIVLLAARDSQRIALPLAELRYLEVSRGIRRRTLEAGLGCALLGGVVGFVANFGDHLWSSDESALTGDTIGAAVSGGALGLLLGSLIGEERWEEVPLRLRSD